MKFAVNVIFFFLLLTVGLSLPLSNGEPGSEIGAPLDAVDLPKEPVASEGYPTESLPQNAEAAEPMEESAPVESKPEAAQAPEEALAAEAAQTPEVAQAPEATQKPEAPQAAEAAPAAETAQTVEAAQTPEVAPAAEAVPAAEAAPTPKAEMAVPTDAEPKSPASDAVPMQIPEGQIKEKKVNGYVFDGFAQPDMSALEAERLAGKHKISSPQENNAVANVPEAQLPESESKPETTPERQEISRSDEVSKYARFMGPSDDVLSEAEEGDLTGAKGEPEVAAEVPEENPKLSENEEEFPPPVEQPEPAAGKSLAISQFQLQTSLLAVLFGATQALLRAF